MFTIKEGTPAEKIGEGTPPEVLKSITDYLSKHGHVIRTVDQDKEFLTNSTQAEIDRVLGERNQKMEETILKTTGIKKNQAEKFYDYHERALVEKLNNVKTLEDKIKKYETEGMQGSEIVKQLKIDLDKANHQLEETNNEWKKKFESKESEIFSSRVESEVDKVLAELRATLDPTIRPELIPDILAARLAKFRSENQPYNSDGLIVWKDPKTQATRTSKQDGKAQNFKDLFTPYLADVAGKPRNQGGAGSGSNDQGHQGGKKYNEITLPDSVKTRVQLTDYLIKEMKMDPNSSDFAKAFDALGVDLKLR